MRRSLILVVRPFKLITGNSMKNYYCLLLSALLVASCSQTPLTDAECRVLTSKEIEFAVQGMSADDAAFFKESLTSNIEPGVAKCVAGETYNQDDYKCMVAAATAPEIKECLAAAAKHRK